MSDELKPALTPEQWRKGETDEVYIDADGVVVYPGSPEAAFSAKEIPSLIALANATLPDDSPYKIARADVEMLQEIALEIVDDNPYWANDVLPLSVLAAKLAALLPPE